MGRTKQVTHYCHVRSYLVASLTLKSALMDGRIRKTKTVLLRSDTSDRLASKKKGKEKGKKIGRPLLL